MYFRQKRYADAAGSYERALTELFSKQSKSPVEEEFAADLSKLARLLGKIKRAYHGSGQSVRVQRIEDFADIVHKAGYASPIRTPRGEDIMAACGQLKSETERARKSRAEIAAEAGLSPG